MRKVRLFIASLLLGSSMLFVSASPAAAEGTCGPKAVCLVYYTACSVAYQAGIQCVD